MIVAVIYKCSSLLFISLLRIVNDDVTLSQITDAVLAVYASQGLSDFTATWAFVATYNNVAENLGGGERVSA